MSDERYRLGIDTGGTFTDFIVAGSTTGVSLFKAPSTPHDPPAAVERGLAMISAGLGLGVPNFLDACDLIIFGTTVGVNALIEKKGARTALLCTSGHEDSLEIRLGHKEDGHRYDAEFPQAVMLVPRFLRCPVRERVLSTGEVRTPLDESDIYRAIQSFKDEGVESVAISFLWSFLHPLHERRAAEIVRRELPNTYVTLSVELLPQIREYTRTSTTVLNAYVGPIIRRYVERMELSLRERGYRNEVRYMQSNGGLTSGRFLADRGVHALNSGPAAGPNAGAFFGLASNLPNVIAVDMGGTSFDISVSTDGKTDVVKDVDFLRYRIGIPMLQVETLGAGGGSIASINAMGILQVGPESAGAHPGPAAYGHGGDKATVTDALVVLGYLSEKGLLGGELRLDSAAARRVIWQSIAQPLGLTVEQAALGIFKVVNANMVSGIRRVSIDKGHDPRDFTLVVGGGAGPAHGAVLAGELGIRKTLIPKLSSAFCAFGEIISDMKHTYLSSCVTRLDEVDCEQVNRLFADAENRGRIELAEIGVPPDRITVQRGVDMRYVDQIHECHVEMPVSRLTPTNVVQIADAFHRRHEELFTYCERDNTVEIINLESIVIGTIPRPPLPFLSRGAADPERAYGGSRRALFDSTVGFIDAAVYDGELLQIGNVVQGPALIDERTTTIVVLPGWEARLEDSSCYMLVATTNASVSANTPNAAVWGSGSLT